MRRCNADLDAPLVLAIPVRRNLPRAWLDGIKRCARIATHPQSFPELTGADVVPDRVRKRRLERLRSVALVSMSMLYGSDRRTLRVGTPREDAKDLVTGIPVAEHSRRTGLCVRCVARALAEVEGKWWVSVQPVLRLKAPKVRKRDGGEQTHEGLPSVRTLRPLFFQRLGITDRKLARARAHGAAAYRARKAPPASLVGIRAMFRHMHDTLDADSERARRERWAARLERLRPKPPVH